VACPVKESCCEHELQTTTHNNAARGEVRKPR